MHLPEIGGKLGLLVAPARDVPVGGDDFQPWLQAGRRGAFNRRSRLAQAAIGPGMAVYTRYAKVLDAAGKALQVREALVLINQTLDETLVQQEGDFDADSRWAVAWFEQFGFDEGEYGIAEMLSKAKNTSVTGMVPRGSSMP